MNTFVKHATWLPDSNTRQHALAEMRTDLHLGRHVHLSKMADDLAGSIQLSSEVRPWRAQ